MGNFINFMIEVAEKLQVMQRKLEEFELCVQNVIKLKFCHGAEQRLPALVHYLKLAWMTQIDNE